MSLNSPVPLSVPVEPDAEEARRWALDELAKSEYRDEPATWLARVGEWLRDLFTGFDGFGSGLGPTGIILVIVLVAALAALVIWLVMGPLRRSRRSAPTGAVLEDDARTAAQMDAAARTAAQAGAWDAAVMEIYRALVRRLDERDVVEVTDGMTADEAARAIGATLPDARDAVGTVARDFDVARYGGGGLGEAAWTHALATYERTSSARRQAQVPS